MPGKRRTRQHVIADLSVHHVEGIALRAGFTVQRMTSDYGVDLLLQTYNRRGEREPGYVFFQLKATDHLRRIRQSGAVAVTLDQRDIETWRKEFHPVVVVMFDAKREVAYWIVVQEYLAQISSGGTLPMRAFRTVRMPQANILTRDTMMKVATLKRKMYVRFQRMRPWAKS